MKPAHDFSHSDELGHHSKLSASSNESVNHTIPNELLADRESLGRLRRELLWTLGEERTHGIFARWGLSCGLSESLHSSSKKIMIEGLGEITDKTSPDSKDEFIFESYNSLEASEHLRFFKNGTKNSQCWILAGYLTGRISGKVGQAIHFIETRCSAKKEGLCRFVGRPIDNWAEEYEIPLQYYQEDNVYLELSQTREQLKLTKDRYQNLFEQASSPIFIFDPETGVHIDVNVAAEELTGYSKAELLSMTIFDLYPQNEHQSVMNRMKSLLTAEPVLDTTLSIVRKDGSDRIVSISSKLMDYGGQQVIQSILRDITDLRISEQKEKDLQDQLSRSERLSSIGRLAASVAHEIKNPLGAIRNAIYYIRSAVVNTPVSDNDPQIKEIIKLAEEEVDGAVVIIEELLDFSRTVNLMPRRTLINELLEKLVTMVNVPENVKLIWDLDITLPAATVDPDRLTQVFCNIATNGIQSMPNGGTLTIRTRLEVETATEPAPNREFVLIMFGDTGSGIHPHHLKKIFEPLFTTKVRGTGLGLAITSNIVEKHGGRILVTSQLGKGTCFTVKLPLHTPQNLEENNHGDKQNSTR